MSAASSSSEIPPLRAVIGLGNPGRDYEDTRHNVGFAIVDRLAQTAAAEWRTEKKWSADVARCSDGTILVKPQTFMNLSGRAAASVGSFFKIPPSAMLVVYDDVDLPLGQLRFRADGSAGGHNGIQSLIECLGGDRFPRLKFGIGRQPRNDDADPQRGSMIGHVLGRFDDSETELLQNCLAIAEDAVKCALVRGLAAAMNQFNQKAKKPAKKPNPAPESTPEPEAAAPESESQS